MKASQNIVHAGKDGGTGTEGYGSPTNQANKKPSSISNQRQCVLTHQQLEKLGKKNQQNYHQNATSQLDRDERRIRAYTGGNTGGVEKSGQP